jgi:hypothetical protein
MLRISHHSAATFSAAFSPHMGSSVVAMFWLNVSHVLWSLQDGVKSKRTDH